MKRRLKDAVLLTRLGGLGASMPGHLKAWPRRRHSHHCRYHTHGRCQNNRHHLFLSRYPLLLLLLRWAKRGCKLPWTTALPSLVLSIDHDNKQIRFEQVGDPIGDSCGATCIDQHFEQFAEDRLGPEDWDKLIEIDVQDQHSAGGHSIVRPKLRRIQEKFQPIKHQFDGSDSKLAWPVQLPRDIGSVEDEDRGLSNGTLKITADDLKSMFHDSVERTLYLIEQAVGLIEICEGLTLRTIFLSGGFAQSKYLYNEVKEFGTQRKIEVKRGDDCWIAVAKGAIIKSMGIYTDKPLFVKSCPRHYGIKVRSRYASYENHLRRDVDVDAEGVEWALDQIRWFVPKGDGLFPASPKDGRAERGHQGSRNDRLEPRPTADSP
ncbi:hypothetical protein BT67DRAFT_260133 [Trichocladium antarcticum]|uniref:Uncharacterized protein n=1 Tax=Trichocladium antarcticum TaxID=1450529 RepID=A0AAN6UMH8_9PEZI|nr:hypothetical protein BT67DRAFT_260133 [Trichocladium antarcticum]